jgi:hypothetical protein
LYINVREEYAASIFRVEVRIVRESLDFIGLGGGSGSRIYLVP